VLAVHAQGLEAVGERLDLALEVLGGEPALAERVGQRVRRRGERDAAVGELAHETGHQRGVARVVELELVDADELLGAQGLDRLVEAEGPHEVGVLDEGAVRDGVGPELLGDGVGERGEQVGLADAEAAVEVDRRCRPPAAEQAAPRRGDLLGDLLQPVQRAGLARVRGVGAVGGEAGLREVPRGHEVGDEPVDGDLGPDRAEGGRRGRGVGGGGGCHEAEDYRRRAAGDPSGEQRHTCTTAGAVGWSSTAPRALTTCAGVLVCAGSALRSSPSTAWSTTTSWNRTDAASWRVASSRSTWTSMASPAPVTQTAPEPAMGSREAAPLSTTYGSPGASSGTSARAASRCAVRWEASVAVHSSGSESSSGAPSCHPPIDATTAPGSGTPALGQASRTACRSVSGPV